MFFSNTEKDNP